MVNQDNSFLGADAGYSLHEVLLRIGHLLELAAVQEPELSREVIKIDLVCHRVLSIVAHKHDWQRADTAVIERRVVAAVWIKDGLCVTVLATLQKLMFIIAYGVELIHQPVFVIDDHRLLEIMWVLEHVK